MTQARVILLGSAIATLVIALFAVGAVITGGAGSQPAGTGQDVSSPRIVAFSPAIAVILADLGLADHIVGRHAFDVTMNPDVPVVGDMNGIDYEQLLRLDPTHVFLERSAHPPPERLIGLGDQHGWKIHALPLLSLDDIPTAVNALADLFQSGGVESRRITLLKELDGALRPIPDIAENAGTVLMLYWTNPPGAAGPGSFHHEILTRLGFTPALREGGPYMTIDPEDILRMDPGSLLLLMPGADEQRLEELLGPLVRLNLRAVEEGRVAVIDHPLVNIPATSIVEGVREIRSETRSWRSLSEGVEK